MEYARYLSGLWDNAWWGAADTLVLILVFLLAAMGFLARLRANPGPLEVFAVLYGVAIMPWIATQGRYLIPLMPLYVGYALWAIQVAGKRSPARGRLLLAGLLVLALAGFASIYTTVSLRRPPEGVGTADAVALWSAVDRISAPGDVVIFQKPRALALFADRRASGIHETANDDETWRYFQSVGARYAILGPDDRVFLNQDCIRRLVEARPERFDRGVREPGIHDVSRPSRRGRSAAAVTKDARPTARERCSRLRERYYDDAGYPGPLDRYREAISRHAGGAIAVLDAGCGAAMPFLREIAPRVRLAVGVDLERLRRDAQGPDGCRADIGRLPFRDRTFDLIISMSVIEHLDDPIAVFRELARVLKPGGRLVVQTPNRFDYVSVIAHLTPFSFHRWVVPRDHESGGGGGLSDTLPGEHEPCPPTRHARGRARAAQGRAASISIPRT